MTLAAPLKALSERWSTAKPAERANAQTYVSELCEALGVEPPRPAGSGYEFELPVKLIARDGTESQGFIDCYKAGHFVLEAKDYEEGRSNDLLLRKAFGQARMYASHDPSGVAPPYLLVLDVAKTILVWDRWSGTFGGYGSARRIELSRLHERPEEAALLVDIWTDPSIRNPRLLSQTVTKEIAGHLAELAASLEQRGFEQERVARFLMRCVFTMFAEDVNLLPDEPFRRLLDDIAVPNPGEFSGAVEELWHAMDEGRRFGFRKLLRFNGHFFRDAEGLPLTREDLTILLEAARADWSRVEPTIFGTLLTRALDPKERHRLGAEYTPPEFIERLVRPTIEEPVRERWTAVQADVLQLRDAKDVAGKSKTKDRIRKDRETAETRLLEFHEWLRSLRILDPACGSGNFLYLAMHSLKRVEVEVFHDLADVRGGVLELRMHEVDPSQFYGIEVKPWAREIAELTLWIGFHQFWRQQHGAVQPEEPLLRDTGTLECRDALLTWDEVRSEPDRGRLDPTPRLTHPVTGGLVPDPTARLPYDAYVGVRPAEWPDADFIIGNPPYMGWRTRRESLGDGYVDALRSAYPDITEHADFVMYWWRRAAHAVVAGSAIRAGLITTNSITQSQNRKEIEAAIEEGAHLVWAIPDHPWTQDGADVRVAMTVLTKAGLGSRLVEVDDDARVVREVRVGRLNADLSAHADVASTAQVPLHAARGLSSNGFSVVGEGFILSAVEAGSLLKRDPSHREIIRPYRNGRDITARPRNVSIIDFGMRSEDEAKRYPVLYDIVRDRVQPKRASNPRATYARYWWRFAEPRPMLRAALVGLKRYIVTGYVQKHRFFSFLDAQVAPDYMLVCIASEDAYHLGVLSSGIHAAWALAAGGRMGVGNDPRYNKSLCLDPFPFPQPAVQLRADIASIADQIDGMRRDAVNADPRVTLTGIYNVLEKLRAGEVLSTAERVVHTAAACGTLRDLHEALDRRVAESYGWEWPMSASQVLEKLVALHDVCVTEEAAGEVRWLRPAYQEARFGAKQADMGLSTEASSGSDSPIAQPLPWPTDAVGQITALRQIAAASPVSVDEATSRFAGAPKAIVARHLETLAILGELRAIEGGRYSAALVAA
jgi:hypothetical protein